MTLAAQVDALAARVGQEFSNYQPLGEPVTRILSHSNGGCGTISGASLTVGTTASIRIPVMLPVGTDKWRIKLRIYDTYSSTAKTAITGTKIIHGDAAVDLTGAAAETGSYADGVATTIQSTSFTIPGNGDYWVSDWVTAPEDQFDADTRHLVGVSWTQTSASAALGIGRCWYWNSANGANPAIAGSAATNMYSYFPIDWVIEYQSTSRRKAFLCIGDSIMEGAQASWGQAISPTSLSRRYTDQWAALPGVNALVQNHALYNSRADQWQNTAWSPWTRQDTSGGQFDGAIVALGSNDAAGFSTSLANYQTYMATILSNIRTIIGSDKPIWVLNIMPRSLLTNGTNPEGARELYNEWLSQRPAGIAGVIDVDTPGRSTSISAIDQVLCSSDKTHPSYQGVGVLTDVLQARIPA